MNCDVNRAGIGAGDLDDSAPGGELKDISNRIYVRGKKNAPEDGMGLKHWLEINTAVKRCNDGDGGK